MKNRHILILARNARQGAKYAKHSDLPNFTYRVIRSAGSITGIQSVDVHLVDGFEQRADHGAILAKLRWARDIAYYSTSMPPEPVIDVGDGMGEQMEIDFDITRDDAPHYADPEKVAKFVDTPSEPAAESLDHVVPDDTAAEPAPKARRKRCKDCGRLAFKPFSEDREGHDEAAHSTQSLFG